MSHIVGAEGCAGDNHEQMRIRGTKFSQDLSTPTIRRSSIDQNSKDSAWSFDLCAEVAPQWGGVKLPNAPPILSVPVSQTQWGEIKELLHQTKEDTWSPQSFLMGTYRLQLFLSQKQKGTPQEFRLALQNTIKTIAHLGWKADPLRGFLEGTRDHDDATIFQILTRTVPFLWTSRGHFQKIPHPSLKSGVTGNKIAPKELLEKVRSTEENLKLSFENETFVNEVAYPAFLKQAWADEDKLSVWYFTKARNAEERHANLYKLAIADMASEKETQYFVCSY